MSTFSKRIRELRKQRKLTQSELADYIGVNKQTISQYERGIRHPDFETLSALCDFFNTSTDYMLGKEDVTLRFVDADDLKRLDNDRLPIRVPILGRVAAGIPIEAIEDIIDYEEIPASWISDKSEYFGLRIRGDSMEPKISDGDVVIVRKQNDADTGNTVIVTVNGTDATCKRLKKYRDGIELIAMNPSYETMFFSNEDIEKLPVIIIGKVVELRSKF